MEIFSLNEIKALIQNDTGILFCFGTSFISRIIAAKTRLVETEIVPTHVALIVNGKFLYESTSQPEKLGNKTIPAGVRRYLLKDFYKLETKKNTTYAFYPCSVNNDKLEKYIHYPYGKDLILDLLLTDGSDGESKGLICSQYANVVTGLMDSPCPTPATMYRFVNSMEDKLNDLL